MDWLPTIRGRTGPAYVRIVEALADDIASGGLHQGQRLPTHRALATALHLDVTTVTRAYSEARRQGLIDARTGRGTFVAATASAAMRRAGAPPAIDLTMILPPQPEGNELERTLVATLSEIRRQPGFAPYLAYQQPGGSAAERAVASQWLAPRVPGLTRERTLVAPGTQSVLAGLLLTLTQPGDTVLTEALTYAGLKAAAALARVNLVGVALDAEGVAPAALAAAQRKYKARVVVLTPTLHNPTTATMGAKRRQDITEVLKRRRLTLIEDDPYVLLDKSATPLAALAPERTYLAATLSKCLAPGLRTSLLVAPDAEAADRAALALRAVAQMPAPLLTAAALRWLQDGRADAIIAAVRAEAQARQALSRDVLGPDWLHHGARGGDTRRIAAQSASPHLWLPSPHAWTSERFAAVLRGRGLAVVASEAFAVAPDAPQGIRLALGSARTRAELRAALEIVREALARAEPGGNASANAAG